MYPVPQVSDLASFSGRPESSYTAYADAALLQSAMTFSFRTECFAVTDLPAFGDMSVADAELMALTGICAYADVIYLRQPYQAVIASPVDSERMGSYNYSKGQAALARQYQGIELTMETTGVALFDLAVQFFAKRTQTGGVYHDGVTLFEGREHASDQAGLYIEDMTGRRFILGPDDRNLLNVPFDINAPEFPHDPGI